MTKTVSTVILTVILKIGNFNFSRHLSICDTLNKSALHRDSLTSIDPLGKASKNRPLKEELGTHVENQGAR